MLSTPVRPGSQRSESGFRLSKQTEYEERVDLNVPTQLRFPNSPQSATSVILRSVSEGFFELFARRRFHLGVRLQLLFRGEQVDGEVMYCRPEGDGFSVGVSSLGPHTVRGEMRYPVDISAVVRIPDSEASIRARIVDVSRSHLGLGLHLPVEIKVGTMVAVELAHGTFFGEIRHCTPENGYFRAGLASRVRPD